MRGPWLFTGIAVLRDNLGAGKMSFLGYRVDTGCGHPTVVEVEESGVACLVVHRAKYWTQFGFAPPLSTSLVPGSSMAANSPRGRVPDGQNESSSCHDTLEMLT